MKLLVAALVLLAAATGARAEPLRVCADPNNLPFSDAALQGFENKIVTLIAADLHATPRYFWWAQRRGFVRNTLKAAKCDVWPGVATALATLTTTIPYYRSTYVFVSRASDHLDISSFDDPRLKNLVVGVQMVGNDANNTPPAHALAARGITANVHGFMLYGDYRQPNPPHAIVDAVANRQIDIALAWGPVGGYFAAKEAPPLRVTPVAEARDGVWPMRFDISMGVRKGDIALRDRLNAVIARDRSAIAAILDAYHVPRVSLAGTP